MERGLRVKINPMLLSQPSLRMYCPKLCTGHFGSWVGGGKTQKGNIVFTLRELFVGAKWKQVRKRAESAKVKVLLLRGKKPLRS